jgi:hypothetical protein
MSAPGVKVWSATPGLLSEGPRAIDGLGLRGLPCTPYRGQVLRLPVWIAKSGAS